MAPLRSLCVTIGVAAVAAKATPRQTQYSIKGATGFDTEGDYIENKIARGVYGVFGTIADEAQEAGRHVKDAAKTARESAEKNARSARESIERNYHKAENKAQSGWNTAESKAQKARDKARSQSHGSGFHVPNFGQQHDIEHTLERNPVARFFSNPNNAFVAQGIVAVIFGALHVTSYDYYGSRIAGPVYKLFGQDFQSIMAVVPHIKLLGGYMLGVAISDALAYKSTSAGFKRGKVWHEMGTTIILTLVSVQQMIVSDEPTDILPLALISLVFASWFGFLAQDY